MTDTLRALVAAYEAEANVLLSEAGGELNQGRLTEFRILNALGMAKAAALEALRAEGRE